MRVSNRPSNRADKVRSRRTTDITQRVKIAGAVASGTASRTSITFSSPVMTRSNAIPTVPLVQRAHKKARRRIYLPFNPLAEIRLPALPFFKPGWRLLSGFLFVLSAAGLYGMIKAPVFHINTVNIHGTERVTTDALRSVIKVEGQKVFLVSPAAVKETLLRAFPEFGEVRVSVGLPASISVYVTERKPVLSWTQNNETRWIDAEGISFPARGDPGIEMVNVLASGNPPAGSHTITYLRQESKKTLASMIQLSLKKNPEPEATETAQFIDPSLIQSVTQIAAAAPSPDSILYSPVYGFGWTDPGGWKVYFGFNASDMPAKISAYKVIVQKLQAQGVSPRLISMEYLYAPYYRTEQ